MVILESAAASVLVAGTVFILRACWRSDQPKMRLVSRKTRRSAGPRPNPQPGQHKRAA